MATLGTMVERIRSDLHQGPATTGPWAEAVRLAIHDAIRKLSRDHYWWDEGTFTLSTIASQETYVRNSAGGSDVDKLPADLLYILDDLYVRDLQSTEDSNPLRRLTRQEYLATKEDWSPDEDTPDFWTWFEDKLHLWPVPDDVHDVVGRYKRSTANITATWNGSAWTFSTDATASAWFVVEQAEMAVRQLACHLVSARYLNDQGRAGTFFALAEDARRELHRETTKKTATGEIRPWLG